MEEVIATKKDLIYIGAILYIVLGLAVVGVGVWYGVSYNQPPSIYLFSVLGCAFTVFGAYKTAIYFRAPKNLIVLKDGVLHFPHGITCVPKDISDCKARIVSRYGGESDFGSLVVNARGRIIKLENVDNIVKVRDRLLELSQGKG